MPIQTADGPIQIEYPLGPVRDRCIQVDIPGKLGVTIDKEQRHAARPVPVRTARHVAVNGIGPAGKAGRNRL